MPNVQSISRTPYYKHYMIPAGWRYSAHLLLWRGSEVETSFAFRRRSDQGDFSDHEMALLRALHPHVATAFERTRLFEGEHRRRNLLEQYYRAKPEAVILLDWNFEVLYSSQEAIALCVAWNLGPEKARFYTPKTMFSLPPEILRECKRIKPSWEQRRTETSDLERPAIAAEVKGERAGFSATITVRREGGSSLTKPLFVIRLLWTTEEKRAKGGLGRKLGSLTPAERNLAKLVCTGLSNKEIAARLRRTEGSVKVQLSGVFQKLRVGSRTKLIAALQ